MRATNLIKIFQVARRSEAKGRRARTPAGSISELVTSFLRAAGSERETPPAAFQSRQWRINSIILQPRRGWSCSAFHQDNGVRRHKLARSLFSRGEEGEKGGG